MSKKKKPNRFEQLAIKLEADLLFVTQNICVRIRASKAIGNGSLGMSEKVECLIILQCKEDEWDDFIRDQEDRF